MIAVRTRAMRPSELDFAAACTSAAGWASETRQELEGYFEHDPAGCFVAEAGHRLVGICTATCYGESGFIGHLIVIQEMRGCGVGRRLLDHAVDYLHRRGTRNILLDGVIQEMRGRGIERCLLDRAIDYLRRRGTRSILFDGGLRAVSFYERAGFRKVYRSLAFSGKLRGKSHCHVRVMQPDDLDAIGTLDRIAFGADRGFFLERRASVQPDLCKVLELGGEVAGYIMGHRVGSRVFVRPWVVRPDVDHPADLLESLAGEVGNSTLGLGILEANHAAVSVVRALGFTARRDPSWRMVLGASGDLGSSPLVYAMGSPAKG